MSIWTLPNTTTLPSMSPTHMSIARLTVLEMLPLMSMNMVMSHTTKCPDITTRLSTIAIITPTLSLITPMTISMMLSQCI